MTQDGIDQTFVLIKPDALSLSLTGYVLSQLSEFHAGLRFAGAKIVHVTRMLAEEHYAEHKGKPFFPAVVEYLMGCVHYPDSPDKRRVIALAYSGPGAVTTVRKIAGPTSPHVARDTAPGTIRALGTIVPLKDAAGNPAGERMDNLVHASSSPSDAQREINLWFIPSDIMPAMRQYATEVCDDYYYLKDGNLSMTREPGSICILAPGQMAWKSDVEAMQKILQGEPAHCTLDAVVAKYLINEKLETS
ncbi:MAG: nucleoside-diphosphate kinase [Candidatus Nealsonbacteria bacterium]|nr:nucleoside-diphosphate kinase [Candidatus Nealsonbacteria bacterium]